MTNIHPQDAAHGSSVSDPERFWLHQADQLHWHTKPKRALDKFTRTSGNGTKYASWSWFPDGSISTSYNCVHRHVQAGNGTKAAIIWESPVTSSQQRITYDELLREVDLFAGVLREQGLKQGDIVLIYSTAFAFVQTVRC